MPRHASLKKSSQGMLQTYSEHKVTSPSWQPRRLDELGFVGRGKSRHRPRNDPRLYGGEYPFIQTADIVAADPYITSYSQTYTDFGLAQSKLWPANTLCITIAGANTAETAILKFEACFPDSIIGFIPDENKADLHFVKHSLDLIENSQRRTRVLEMMARSFYSASVDSNRFDVRSEYFVSVPYWRFPF